MNIYISINNVLELYLPFAGRITRCKSTAMYVLYSVSTAVPYNLDFPDLSRPSLSYTVYFFCCVVYRIFGKGTTPRFIIFTLFIYVFKQLGTTLYKLAARQHSRKQHHTHACGSLSALYYCSFLLIVAFDI